MNKVLDSDDEVNHIKRIPRTAEERAIIKPWQNEIMAKFLLLLFEEQGTPYLIKENVLRKYNEAGVPITWQRLQITRVMFEKKVNLPPWSSKVKVTIIVPMGNSDHMLKNIEEQVSNILITKVDKEHEKFPLPVRLAEIQKEYQLNMRIDEPPLFIVNKLLDSDMDTLFYKTLEQRRVVRDSLIKHLRSEKSQFEWA